MTRMLFGVLVVIFGVTFPLALSSGGGGAACNQAALIAQHKIDELRQAGFSPLNQPSLVASVGARAEPADDDRGNDHGGWRNLHSRRAIP